MKRLFQSNGNGAHRKSAIDSDLLRILVPPVICVVICCTFFVGASWAWFTDSATCGVEDIKANNVFPEKVNVTVNDMSAVSPMLLAAVVESTEAEEETEQPTEWTLEPDKGYDVTLQWPNAQTEGYCVITIGSSQYRTKVFSNTLSFKCYTTGMKNPVVMKIDGFSGGYEEEENEMIIREGGKIGEEPEPEPTPEATASPEPTPTPEATASPEPTPVPEATVSPEPAPTEDPTPTAAPTTEPAPETSVSPESTPTEDPTPTAAPTTENAEGQEQSEAQTSAPASQG